MENNIINYDSPEYKRSRKAYTAQCAVEYFGSLLVTDIFLAKLLTSIGVNNALTGIISSFVSVAFIFQLLSLYLVNAKVGAKVLVMIFSPLSIFFFTLLYLTALLPFGDSVKTVLAVICIIVAYASQYLVASIGYRWGNSFVDPKKRASFSATKEIISLISGMAFSLTVSYIIDHFFDLDRSSMGFLFIAVSMLVINVFNFLCLALIKRDERDTEAAESEPVISVVKKLFANKDFCHIVILTALWDTARYFTVGFIGTFKTEDLAISVFLGYIINSLANLMRMLVSRPFGKFSDEHSYAKGFEVGLYIAAAAFLVNAFTTRSTWWLVIAHTVLYNCCLAGTNQNSFNITYSYVETKYFPQALAIKNSVGGICGFAASLVAGKLLSAVQANGNMIFGITVYGQQIQSAISFIIIAAAIIYTRKVIAKQKVVIR